MYINYLKEIYKAYIFTLTPTHLHHRNRPSIFKETIKKIPQLRSYVTQ
jgi:hypothetical protein